MDKLHYYDGLISLLVSNLKISAENNTISLGQFDPKNDSHLCIFQAAKIARDLFGLRVTVDLGFFSYLVFTRKFHCRKGVRRGKGIPVVNCPALVREVENANEVGILTDIYHQYYRG